MPVARWRYGAGRVLDLLPIHRVKIEAIKVVHVFAHAPSEHPLRIKYQITDRSDGLSMTCATRTRTRAKSRSSGKERDHLILMHH